MSEPRASAAPKPSRCLFLTQHQGELNPSEGSDPGVWCSALCCGVSPTTEAHKRRADFWGRPGIRGGISGVR